MQLYQHWLNLQWTLHNVIFFVNTHWTLLFLYALKIIVNLSWVSFSIPWTFFKIQWSYLNIRWTFKYTMNFFPIIKNVHHLHIFSLRTARRIPKIWEKIKETRRKRVQQKKTSVPNYNRGCAKNLVLQWQRCLAANLKARVQIQARAVSFFYLNPVAGPSFRQTRDECVIK